MQLAESMRIALASLWANKLRSVLTLLGIVIGVAAVIAVVTFINGLNAYVAEKVVTLGADVGIIQKQPAVITSYDQYKEAQKRRDFKLEDYEYLKETCKKCKDVAASWGTTGTVKSGLQSSSNTSIRGWTASMQEMTDQEITAGRPLTEVDVSTVSHVAVVGTDIVENLLGNADPIGSEVRVAGVAYRVIGVGKKQGKTLGQSQDNWVAIPVTTYERQFGTSGSMRLFAKAYGTGAPLQEMLDEVRVLMRAKRHLAPNKPDDFELNTNDTYLSLWSSISSGFFLVTIAIASISLVVGGIVIMNIMLVSVTERTREIGVRKALGARKSDIQSQFLIESGTMSLVGGAFGIISGGTLAKLVTLIIGMPSRIEIWSVIVGLVVAASVGIFFGVYPARKAADLDPIVALRSEL
ncbi:MAG: ABC transporter permease [Acidobacteriales bacterium]|nr:ABC transporter permease [Terriglobales bacterium]